MLVALKKFQLNGVQVEPGHKLTANLPPKLVSLLVATRRARRLEEAVLRPVVATKAFRFDGQDIKPGDIVPVTNPEKRRVLLNARFVEEADEVSDAPTPMTVRPRRRRTNKKG